MNCSLLSFRNIILSFLGIMALSLFTSCEKTSSCPDGNLCVEGNILTYQTRPIGAKLIIDAPPGSVYNNAAVVITDMVPYYPSTANYNTYERFFAGGMFKIEPIDLVLKKLITVSIEYPGDGFIDLLGNNYEDGLILYYIDKDWNWSIVNASMLDVSADRVSAQVTRLGTYAVGAVKDCIIGDWRFVDGFSGFEFLQRVVFYVDGKGKREFAVLCNNLTDTAIAVENFSWKFEQTQLSLYNFSARVACDTLGYTTPDRTIDYECTGPTLTLFDLPLITFSRYY